LIHRPGCLSRGSCVTSSVRTRNSNAALHTFLPSFQQWRRNEFESGRGHRNFFSCPSTFFGSTSTISRFGERFRGGQYGLVSFLFAVLLTVRPLCPAICKSGGHVPYGVGASVADSVLGGLKGEIVDYENSVPVRLKFKRNS